MLGIPLNPISGQLNRDIPGLPAGMAQRVIGTGLMVTGAIPKSPAPVANPAQSVQAAQPGNVAATATPVSGTLATPTTASDATTASGTDFSTMLSTDYAGFPLWAWLAGGLGLILVLKKGR